MIEQWYNNKELQEQLEQLDQSVRDLLLQSVSNQLRRSEMSLVDSRATPR